VLEIHQSNEGVYESALRELARCYEDAGLTEEHIRFFVTLALYCIPGLNATAENLAQVIPLIKDKSPEVRSQVGGVLNAIGKGEHKDQIIPALTTLLKDSDSKVVERTLQSMWGQYASPEFDALLIGLSRDPQYQGTAVYYCLSTMRTKSLPVCQRLIEVMQGSSKHDDRARAAWGLTYGVVEDAKPLVEAGLLTALPQETDQDARTTGFRALRLVATETSRPYLRSVLASDMESEDYRQLAREILQDLDKGTQ